jgi:xylulokinase
LMQGFDEAANAFDRRLTEADLGLHLLPPIYRTSDLVGQVTAAAAAATGIPQGTPVAAGAIDAVGSALEAGAVEVGDPLVEMTGFSSVTMLTVPSGTQVDGFIHARHCMPGVDLLITAQVTAGATIDWVNSLDKEHDLRDSDTILSRPRPSRLTFVPSLAGDRTPTWNTGSRGIIDGIDLATDGTDMMLAAMEGNALALANDLDTLTAHGFAIDRIISTGGGASSTAWLQIKADITGLPVSRPATGHGAAQGASYLAGIAVGARTTASEIRELSAEELARFQPDPAIKKPYAAKRARFNLVAGLNAGRNAASVNPVPDHSLGAAETGGVPVASAPTNLPN